MSDHLKKSPKKEDPAVINLREYIKIKTVHPEPDYDSAVSFLHGMANEIGLQYKTVEVHPGRTVVIMTLEGKDSSLPSILLNSHTDVVPVSIDQWKYDPFEAIKTANGDIYGRGTQAIRRLKKENAQCNRTIHLTFMPDEELGGTFGMAKFVKTKEFRDLNVGFALDEGLANPTDTFRVFYGQRSGWWIRVKCRGKAGHGARFIDDSAAQKFRNIINSFLDFRCQEEEKLKGNNCLRLGDVTTVNLTNVEGGVFTQLNVVPDVMYAGFDIRITPSVDLIAFEDQIKKWCKEAGDDVSYEFLAKSESQETTSIAESDPWWRKFKTACEKMGMKLETEIFPAATDSKFIRACGIPAIGFSPMNNTPILLHDHNEFINENIFLKGIDIFCGIILALAN